MICKKCNREMYPNKTVCPHCGNTVVKKYQETNYGAKNKYIKNDSSNLIGGTVTQNKGSVVKIQKKKQTKKVYSGNNGTRNRYIKEDNTNLVGGTVSKGNKSFIKIEKRNNTANTINNVNRKDYINYIDYKSAIEEQELRKNKLEEAKNKKYTEDEVSTKLISIEKVRRSPKVGLELLRKDSEDNLKDIGTKVASKYNNGLIDNNGNKKVRPVRKQPVPIETFTNSNYVQSKQTSSVPNYDSNVVLNVEQNKKRNFKLESNILSYAVIICIWIIAIITLINVTGTDFYFSENNEVFRSTISSSDSELIGYEGVSKSGQSGGASSEGVTSIVYDNQYLGQFTLKNLNAAYDLIRVDSTKQKGNCPSNIVEIEEEIVNNYGITAVNLCEMDEDFALEIKNVVKNIYANFPSARNYLTNLTLANVSESSTFMAAFMPIFTFSTSNSNSGYPVSTKTQIILNAKYFLNNTKIKNSVSYGAKSGYFPKNATRSSTVAHEFGHYLSYVALLNYYDSKQLTFVNASQTTLLYEVYDDFNAGNFSKMLVQEAYDDYVRDTGSTESFYEFRASISMYAVAKDSNGLYIYDETIAEAFHDYYLNGNNAAPASLAIVKVLKSKL